MIYKKGDLVYLRKSIPDEWKENDKDWKSPEFFERFGIGPFLVLRGNENSRYLKINVSSRSRVGAFLVRPEEVLPYTKPILEEEADWE